jgi:deoxyribonuclease-2
MAVKCLLIALVLLVECFEVSWSSVGCLDNNGNAVDWFIVYKLPHLKTSKHPAVQAGVGQMYMDVNSQHWKLLDKRITDKGHAVYNTLQQIYTNSNNKQEIAYILYNDETPSGKERLNHGHTKGDMCFDKTSGFWLVHSVPKFPPQVSDGYSYPDSGTVFGQTFLCVTYGYQQFNVIGGQLLYNYPQIYDHNLPTDFIADNANVDKVMKGSRVESAPWNKSVRLLSAQKQEFISFAKFSNYQRDLYDAWVAPYLASELDVETWQNGRAALPSNCSTKYHVLNVKKLNVSGEYFKNSKDHAKWAITSAGNWICIGDINRESTQFHRPGGTVCSELPRVHSAFRNSVVSTEKCNQREFIVDNNLVANKLQQRDIL